MTSNTDHASPSFWQRGEQEVSLARLYVIRVGALAGVISLGSNNLPALISPDPVGRGMITAILGGLCVMAAIGILHPLKMVPILLFEFVWKTIWLVDFGAQQWLSGQRPPTFDEDFLAIGVGVILMPLVIPWTYVWRQYVTARSERWR
jgi:hypothetical protein